MAPVLDAGVEETWLCMALRAAAAAAPGEGKYLKVLTWQAFEVSRRGFVGEASHSNPVLEFDKLLAAFPQPGGKLSSIGQTLGTLRCLGRRDLAARLQRRSKVRNGVAHSDPTLLDDIKGALDGTNEAKSSEGFNSETLGEGEQGDAGETIACNSGQPKEVEECKSVIVNGETRDVGTRDGVREGSSQLEGEGRTSAIMTSSCNVGGGTSNQDSGTSMTPCDKEAPLASGKDVTPLDDTALSQGSEWKEAKPRGRRATSRRRNCAAAVKGSEGTSEALSETAEQQCPGERQRQQVVCNERECLVACCQGLLCELGEIKEAVKEICYSFAKVIIESVLEDCNKEHVLSSEVIAKEWNRVEAALTAAMIAGKEGYSCESELEREHVRSMIRWLQVNVGDSKHASRDALRWLVRKVFF